MGNSYGDDHLLLLLLLPPEDVLIQILVWVPVTSLLRFKSVCKSWRALIQTSFFIDLHTATTFNSSSSSSSSFGTFIFQTYSDSSIPSTTETMFPLPLRASEFLLLSYGSGSGSGGRYRGTDHEDDDHHESDDDDQVFRVHSLGFPLSDKLSRWLFRHIVMVGSCNGLICIHNSKLRETSLWNPATRQFRFLEGINSLPAQPLQGKTTNNGLYLNGCYFFVGIKIYNVQYDGLIFSFDFTKEIFTTILFPDHDDRYSFVLSSLGEKIALFTSLRRDDESGCDKDYDIWVFNEHGNKESWTKLHSQVKTRGPSYWTIPRGISNNEEFCLNRN